MRARVGAAAVAVAGLAWAAGCNAIFGIDEIEETQRPAAAGADASAGSGGKAGSGGAKGGSGGAQDAGADESQAAGSGGAGGKDASGEADAAGGKGGMSGSDAGDAAEEKDVAAGSGGAAGVGGIGGSGGFAGADADSAAGFAGTAGAAGTDAGAHGGSAGLDASAGNGGSGGSAGSAGGAGTAGSGAEVCNFVDDNGDGQVDEGFDWELSPWTTIGSAANYAICYRAILLSNGNVAVACEDGTGEGNGVDKNVLWVVDHLGNPVAGPAKLTFADPGWGYYGIDEPPTGSIALFQGSWGWSGPSTRLTVTLLDRASLSTVSSQTMFLQYQNHGPQGVAWTGTSHVALLAGWPNGSLHLMWLNAAGDTVLKDVPFVCADQKCTGGNAVVSPYGIAFAYTDGNPPSKDHLGIAAMDGAGMLLSPIELFYSGFDGRYTNIAWLGDKLARVYTDWTVTPNLAKAVTYFGTGQIAVGPVTFDSGFAPFSLVSLGLNLVAATLPRPAPPAGSAYEHHIVRLNGQLQPVPTPHGKMSFTVVDAYPVMVATKDGLLIAKGTYSGKTFDLARVRCPASSVPDGGQDAAPDVSLDGPGGDGGTACSGTCGAACLATCGDSTCHPSESCVACNECACSGGCGNGKVEAAEQCDDGNKDTADLCTNACASQDVRINTTYVFSG